MNEDTLSRHLREPKFADRLNLRSRENVGPGLKRVPHTSILVLILLFPMMSNCQELIAPSRDPAAAEKPPFLTDVTIWTGQTAGSINLMSTYSGQEMFAMGVAIRQRLRTFRHTEMRWNFEALPLVMPSFRTVNGRNYHYGGGGSLGLNLSPRKQWMVQPFFDANIGLVGFTTDTPANTRRTNFSLQFGPGFVIPLRGRSSLKVGLRFFHFSNASTVAHNPGFDGLLIYTGYAFNLGRRSQLTN
jgi:hypothetical protein